MIIKSIELVQRKDGFFYYHCRKIVARKPLNGYGVALILEPSPVDDDFGENILFLSESQRVEILEKFKESDARTANMIGHDWTYGVRPYNYTWEEKIAIELKIAVERALKELA